MVVTNKHRTQIPTTDVEGRKTHGRTPAGIELQYRRAPAHKHTWSGTQSMRPRVSGAGEDYVGLQVILSCIDGLVGAGGIVRQNRARAQYFLVVTNYCCLPRFIFLQRSTHMMDNPPDLIFTDPGSHQT